MQIDSLKIKVGSQWKEAQKIFVKTSSGWKKSNNFYQKINNEWVSLRKDIILVNIADTVAGDICLWDGTKKLFGRFVDSGATHNITNYTPIGVVVVPASHNVYNDGSCGVISLKPMNCSTPSTGSTSEQSMYWGKYNNDISTLPNLNQAPYVGTGSNVGDTNSTVTGQYYYTYLPSDKFSAVQCPHDTDTYYFSSSSSNRQAPSPYLTDDSRNPAYYQTTSPSSSNNCLADFDGIGNTSKILTVRGTKDYSSWIPTYNLADDYPAASCCDMFYTEGTSQGDWYLPAMGELCYIMPPFNKINQAIHNIQIAYGLSIGVELDTDNRYWSSTESSSVNARLVITDSGYVYTNAQNRDGCVRAFLRVSPLDLGIDPEQSPDGIYVYANNGKLYTIDDWDTSNNSMALGVAVIIGDCKFVIDKNLPITNNIQWGGEGTDIPDLTNMDYYYGGRYDYSGESNTNIIVSELGNSTSIAAGYCKSQSLNGQNGYLPAAGELYEMRDHIDAIDNILVTIGSKSISDRYSEFYTEDTASPYGPYFWSSTEYSADTAWYISWSPLASYLWQNNKNNTAADCFAFPVFPI